MKKLSLFRRLLLFATLLLLVPIGASAQVTIGAGSVPQSFSVLELISNNERGLRLPHLTTAQRDALTPSLADVEAAEGLKIFNTDSKCVEYWNSATWISLCANSFLPLTQPLLEGAHIQPGEAISLELGAATGGVPGAVITYQWQSCTADCHIESNWKDIPEAEGGTNLNLDIAAGELNQTTTFRRQATDGEQTNTSNAAVVTVAIVPLTQPLLLGKEVAIGDAATIELGAATGGRQGNTITYQWETCTTDCHIEANWTKVEGATNLNLDIPAGTFFQDSNFRRVATAGEETHTSNAALVTAVLPALESNARVTAFTNVSYDFQNQELRAFHSTAATNDVMTGLKWLVAGSDRNWKPAPEPNNGRTYRIPVDMIHEYPEEEFLYFRCVVTLPAGNRVTQEFEMMFIRTTDGKGNTVGNYGIDANGVRYLTINRGGDLNGGKIKIMLLNLGVEETDGVGLGDLYQWGRIADGHQRIVWDKNPTTGGNILGEGTSRSVNGDANSQVYNSNGSGQIDPSNSSFYGNFIIELI